MRRARGFSLLELLLWGAPWEAQQLEVARLILSWAVRLALFAGFVRAQHRWPVPELTGIYLLSIGIVSGFGQVFGWYHFWGDVFGRVLVVFSAAELWRLYGERRQQRELASGELLHARQETGRPTAQHGVEVAG